MADENKQWSNITSYLSGNLTADEKASFEVWISSADENRTAFLEAKKIWENAGLKLQPPEIDSEALLLSIKSKINSERQTKTIPLLSGYAWKIAASITIIIASYALVRFLGGDNIIVKTEDEVATFYLPDSSRVWLNTNSQVSYSKKFKTRNVVLSGEAFLSVKKDNSDFTVTTNKTVTKVVGTKFNLKEHADQSVTLTVAEGVVNFSNIDSEKEENVVVEANEKAVFHPKSKLIKTKNDDRSFAKWREVNNPVFENEVNDPIKFISNDYAWRKNNINQSVIEGTLINHASLAAYAKIVLSVTYTKPDGTIVHVDFTINHAVPPGEQLKYKKRLLDLFSDTKSVVVDVKSAVVLK